MKLSLRFRRSALPSVRVIGRNAEKTDVLRSVSILRTHGITNNFPSASEWFTDINLEVETAMLSYPVPPAITTRGSCRVCHCWLLRMLSFSLFSAIQSIFFVRSFFSRRRSKTLQDEAYTDEISTSR